MKHFFSINKIFPDICIDIKFCLNHVFDLIEEKHTHYRILNAIYILSIDLKDDVNFDSGTMINDFIKLIRKLLKLEQYEDNHESDPNLSVTIFLDVFFLLKFPKNCNFINIVDSNISELKLYNFWVLRQLTNELYQNSREGNYNIHEIFFLENKQIENKYFKLKGRSILQDALNKKPNDFVEDLEGISQVFEYKNSVTIGIPTFLDFDCGLNKNKRINFFYMHDEMDVVYKSVIFSFSLKNEILENLFSTLKRFQNKYQYNPVSILIYRLIICRYSKFGKNIMNPLVQLLENSKSDALVTSLFECSLLVQDEELFNIFDFYSQLEYPCDFFDVILTINSLIITHLKNFPSSLNKLSPWIKTKNINMQKLDRKLINMKFSNTIEMVKCYLSHLKTELCIISNKLEILMIMIKEDIDRSYVELTLNEIKVLLFSTPIFNRNNTLNILCKLFSIDLSKDLNLMNTNNYIADYGSTKIAGYLEHELASEFAFKKRTDNCSKIVMSNTFAINNCELFHKSDLSTLTYDLRFRSIRLLMEVPNYDFQKELLFVLQTVSKRQQLIFWWYLTSHEATFISEFVSKLSKERRRLGALQCYIRCMEIELRNMFINRNEQMCDYIRRLR